MKKYLICAVTALCLNATTLPANASAPVQMAPRDNMLAGYSVVESTYYYPGYGCSTRPCNTYTRVYGSKHHKHYHHGHRHMRHHGHHHHMRHHGGHHRHMHHGHRHHHSRGHHNR